MPRSTGMCESGLGQGWPRPEQPGSLMLGAGNSALLARKIPGQLPTYPVHRLLAV